MNDDIISRQIIEYENSSITERQSYCEHTQEPLKNKDLFFDLKNELVNIKLPTENIEININDFENWLVDFSAINELYEKMGDVYIEKCLEHYLAFKYLNISQKDVVIDIAACGSPFAKILIEKGIKSYRLDMSYPEGINGINIGADAGDTKLLSEFADVLCLQCAYECFMGDADIRFIKEAGRILKNNGRVGIVPLYLDDSYYIITSPYCNQNNIVIDEGAKRVWREDKYKAPFSRHYSLDSFNKRIHSNIPNGMKAKILFFQNLPDIMKKYANQRIYCYFMLLCEKKCVN
ncbi:hypothetical protein KA977_05295 [Candidatus Dependentiae bacterium]|nr:hypothetical protein [Candidatus Dependentiae bacterium]